MRRRTSNNKGFTLVEILVVITLTVIILGLVFGPLVQTFNFTRRAEAMVKAQDNARLALAQISRDLADAMYAYDNTGTPIYFPVRHGTTGAVVNIPIYYAKVDLVLPRMRGYCKSEDHPVGLPREYSRHEINPLLDEAAPTCPEDRSPLELRPAQPLAADTLIVRYFIGLRDPSEPYANSFGEGPSGGAEDNMFVLYRAEFSPYDDKLFDQSKTVEENLADPNFFYSSAEWKRVSRPLVTLENTDLVVMNYDEDGTPLVTPTVRFMPTPIHNDPMVPTTESDDDPEHGDAPPTVYKASYGYWTPGYEVTLFRDSQPEPSVSFTVDPVKGTANFAVPVEKGVSSDGMAFSLAASTDFINEEYEYGTFRDRYRRLLINKPADRPIPGATVVAGSERVVAPDAAPGSSYGRPLEYGRTPLYLYEPGLNQYQLDLDHPVVDPNGALIPGMEGTGAITFHSNQTTQPGSGVALPPGQNNVLVYYEVQNNKKGDSLRGAYVTKSLMTVIVGVRIYDPASGKPQSIQLTNKVRLRNIAL